MNVYIALEEAQDGSSILGVYPNVEGAQYIIEYVARYERPKRKWLQSSNAEPYRSWYYTAGNDPFGTMPIYRVEEWPIEEENADAPQQA